MFAKVDLSAVQSQSVGRLDGWSVCRSVDRLVDCLVEASHALSCCVFVRHFVSTSLRFVFIRDILDNHLYRVRCYVISDILAGLANTYSFRLIRAKSNLNKAWFQRHILHAPNTIPI